MHLQMLHFILILFIIITKSNKNNNDTILFTKKNKQIVRTPVKNMKFLGWFLCFV